MRRAPITTLVLALSFVFIYFWPDAVEQSLYHREAILNGEFWRIFTAPLTHLSLSHLLWNLSIFVIFGVALERSSKRLFWAICLSTTLLTGLAYLMLSPELKYYGGISGIASGIVAYLALKNIHAGSNSKRLWQLILFLLIVKPVVEAVIQSPIFVSTDNTFSFIVLPSAHLIGIVVALACWLWELRAAIGQNVMAIQIQVR